MTSVKRYATLDLFRLFAAFLIVSIHTSPLLSFDETADFILTRIVARIAVPFFFMVTGYFMFPHIEKGDKGYVKQFCKKTGIIYVVAILLYLPLNIYASYFNKPDLYKELLKDILFDGTFYHLWYLPAALTGILIVAALLKIIRIRTVLFISMVLYLIGLCGDSYYGISSQITIIEEFYHLLFKFSDYTRNGIFFAPIFLTLGSWIGYTKKQIHPQKCMIALILSTALLFIEGILLHYFNIQRHDSMYLMLVPCMYFLFHLLLQNNGKNNKYIRTISMLIYLVHPWMIVLIRGFAKVAHLQNILIDNSMIHYLAVGILSFAVAWFLVITWSTKKKIKPSKDSRAWVEIDLAALTHNAKTIQQQLPKGCELMAVVKANAYGHGDVLVSKVLNKIAIRAFAVATLAEGIHLRKSGIKGEILILGYTNPTDINFLVRYQLTQTVINYEYAKSLNDMKKKVKVHIKLDTGMHRLGEDYTDLDKLEQILSFKFLIVEGMFTHLCVADSLSDKDVTFSQLQIDRFTETVSFLQAKGYSTGKLHVQSSYGMLNYSELTCDYVRAGIALYGVLSNNSETSTKLDLQPVLSVKARVAMIKQLSANESVGYGRLFTADADRNIATVSIGYADGIPRNLSEADSYVLLHSKKAPILGRVCMDQFVIDITNIDGVKPNDVVTIIGSDGDETIHCEDFAEQCGTIANEILARLGNRLNYIYKNN